jgi:hypothetical protein
VNAILAGVTDCKKGILSLSWRPECPYGWSKRERERGGAVTPRQAINYREEENLLGIYSVN